MLEIRLQVTPHLLQTVVDLIQVVVQSFHQGLAIEVDPIEEDPDLHYAWLSGLCDGLRQDVRVLVKLMNDKRFRDGLIVVDEAEAEAVLRASSALRIKVQQTLLKNISDAQLENGMVPFEQLGPEEQKGYACFLFLASLQGVLLEAIDPSLRSFMEEGGEAARG